MRSKRLVYSSTAASPRVFTSARMLAAVRSIASSSPASKASKASSCFLKSGLVVSSFRIVIVMFFYIQNRPEGRQMLSLSIFAAATLLNASSIGCSKSRLSFKAAWFTIRREEMSAMCSTSTKSFARSVLPVLTRSTIASDKPTSGASSIEPYNLIKSTCTPLAAKCSRAACTYLVATRRRAPLRTAF